VRIHTVPAWAAATNAYIVAPEPGGLAFIVDAPPQPDLIAAELLRHDLTPVAILLTHGHVDHTGGSGELSKTTGAGVFVHPDDDFLTLHPEEQVRSMFGMLVPGSYEIPFEFSPLAGGSSLTLAGANVEVRHTPGHTPGHCCFLIQSEGILFAGDQLFAGSVGRTDFPRGSWDQLHESMRTQVMTLDDQVRVLPGHGPETTVGQERRTNPFRGEWAD